MLSKDKAKAAELLQRLNPHVDIANVHVESEKSSTSTPLSRLFSEGRAVGTVFLWLGFGMCMLMVYGLNTWLPKIMIAAGYPLDRA